MAPVVKPIADKLLEQQTQANLPDYNKRYDTATQLINLGDRLQHRDDSKLEVIPDLERGTKDSVIHKDAIQKWEVIYSETQRVLPEEIVKEVTAPLEEKLDMLDGSKFDPQHDPSLSQESLEQVNERWRQYRKALNQNQQNLTNQTSKKETVKQLILPVKQFNQWDSQTEEGQRMCASSTVSMAINYLSPGLITQEMLKETGYSQLDDFYLKELVEKNGGNTNNPDFHIQILTALGFQAHLAKNCSWATIDAQLRDGIPVPMVIAHHGHVGNPDLERWHWILCRGISENPQSKAHIYNDPYGELNVVSGGYQMGNGASMQYSDKNLTPRWQTDGPNRGWAIIIKPPFPKAKARQEVAKPKGNPGTALEAEKAKVKKK